MASVDNGDNFVVAEKFIYGVILSMAFVCVLYGIYWVWDFTFNLSSNLLMRIITGRERWHLQDLQFVWFFQNEVVREKIKLLNETVLNAFTVSLRLTEILEGGGWMICQGRRIEGIHFRSTHQSFTPAWYPNRCTSTICKYCISIIKSAAVCTAHF